MLDFAAVKTLFGTRRDTIADDSCSTAVTSVAKRRSDRYLSMSWRSGFISFPFSRVAGRRSGAPFAGGGPGVLCPALGPPPLERRPAAGDRHRSELHRAAQERRRRIARPGPTHSEGRSASA